MAIIELIFPQLTKDPVLVKEASEKIPPVALRVFKQAGVIRASRGIIDLENGKDITADVKELVILEWKDAADFHAFVKSKEFADYMVLMKPYAIGPPELNLFEANASSPIFAGRDFLEILLIRPNKEEDIEAIVTTVKSSLEKAGETDTIYGTTTNLPKKVATIIRAFSSAEERAAAKQSHEELTNELGKLANLTLLYSENPQFL
ncbi:hypothetical protein ABKA04_001951 [Annulohypoxylon sp. FPYF3050]